MPRGRRFVDIIRWVGVEPYFRVPWEESETKHDMCSGLVRNSAICEWYYVIREFCMAISHSRIAHVLVTNFRLNSKLLTLKLNY
jgi:hypothetical protein